MLHPPALRLQSITSTFAWWGRVEGKQEKGFLWFFMRCCYVFIYNQAIRWKNQNIKNRQYWISIKRERRKKKHRTVSAGECSEMAKLIASRRCRVSGFEASQPPNDCMFFTHTRRRRFFTYREIFMFINFISKRSSCVRSGGCCCWLSVLYFERLDVFVSGRRACSERGDVWTITMAMQSI